MKEEKESTSESPFGLSMPHYQKRLETAPEGKVDPETIMMKLWEEETTRKSWLNCGIIPLDHILHECNPECGKKRLSFLPIADDLHRYNPELNERDKKIVAATVQWLATNCGRAFYETFQRDLHKAWKEYRDKEVEKSNTPTNP